MKCFKNVFFEADGAGGGGAAGGNTPPATGGTGTGTGTGTNAGAGGQGNVAGANAPGTGSGTGTGAGASGTGNEDPDPFKFGNKAGDSDGKTGDSQGEKAPAVPEKYEFKLAEGLTIGKDLADKLTQIGKASGISQEAMDKLLDMHGSVINAALHQAEQQKNDWMNECTKQGLSSEQNLKLAASAVRTFGGGDAMKILVDTGAAYHPAVQKMLQTIGSLLQEDSGSEGKAGGNEPSKADLYFPNSK